METKNEKPVIETKPKWWRSIAANYETRKDFTYINTYKGLTTKIIFLPFDFYWQCLVGLTVIISVFFTIYNIVYEEYGNMVYKDLLIFCDAIYFLDFILAIIHRNMKSVSTRRVYLPRPSSLLIIDMVSLLPIGQFYDYVIIDKEGHWEGLSKVLHLSNLLRVYKLANFFLSNSSFEIKNFHPFISVLVSHFILQGLICHILASIWYKLGCWKCTEPNWTINLEAKAFDPSSNVEWFIWSFTIMSGLFSHVWNCEIRAETDRERWLFAVTMLLGFLVTCGLLYGRIMIVVLKTNQGNFIFRYKVRMAQIYLANWNASKELTKKTIDYYKAFWVHRSGTKESKLLNELPITLRKDVYVDIFWEALKHSHLFRDIDISFKRSLSLYMKSEFLLPGEPIYTYGSVKARMVYIVTGVVQLLSDEDLESPLASFSSGTIFGEMSLLLPMDSTANVKCLTYCELHILDLPSLFYVLRDYPLLKSSFNSIVKQRIALTEECKQITRMIVRRKAMDMQTFWEIEEAGNQEMKWLKDRCRRLGNQQSRLVNDEEEDESDAEYWKCEQLQSDEEICQHTSQYVDLYAISKEMELKHDVVCLKTVFPWIFEPDSGFLQLWEFVMILVVLVFCVMLPYTVAFQRELTEQTMSAFWVCSIFYFADLAVKVTTAIKTKDAIITNLYAIARYRFKQPSFLLDLVSTVPIAALMPESVTSAQVRLFFRCNRLLRIFRLYGFFIKLEENLFYNILVVRLLKYAILFAFIPYYWASLMYIIACPEQCYATSWYVVHKAQDLAEYGKLVNFESDFIISSFYSFQTFTGIGLPELYPNRTIEIIFMLIGQLLRSAIAGFLVAELAVTFVLQSKHKTTFKELAKEVRKFASDRKLPISLQARIERFLYVQWAHNKGAYMMTSNGILNEITPVLRQEIFYSEIEKLLKLCPLFKDTNPDFVRDMVKVAKVYTLPDRAHITTEIVRSTALHFIRNGSCELKSHTPGDLASNRDGTVLQPGTAFPIVDFLMQIPCSVSVRTLSSCEVVSIEYSDFMEAVVRYPTIDNELKVIIQGLRDYVKENTLRATVTLSESTEHVYPLPTSLNTNTPNFFHYTPEEEKVSMTPERLEYLKPFRQLRSLRWIRFLLLKKAIHPEGKFLKYWEFTRVTSSMLAVILAPMFYNVFAPWYEFRFYVGIFFTVHGLLDVYVRFNVGYYSETGLFISHPLYAARYYFTHAFALDLFATFPFTYIQVQNIFGITKTETSSQVIVACTRGLQIYRFIGLCKYYESDIGKSRLTVKALRYTVLFLIICHYAAIALSYAGCSYNFQDKYTFVGIKCHEFSALHNSRFRGSEKNTVSVYLLMFYNTITMVATTASGTFRIEGNDSMVIYMIAGLGLSFLRLVSYSVVASMMIVGNVNLNINRERMKSFVRFMKDEEIEADLLKESIGHLEYNWYKTKGTDINEVIGKFHLALREDIVFELYSKTFKAVDMFEGADNSFYRSLGKTVKFAHFKRNTFVIRLNEVHSNIYFINSGIVDVIAADYTKLTSLGEGCFFGNFTNSMKSGRSFIANHNLELLELPTHEFNRILELHKHIKTRFKRGINLNPEYFVSKSKVVVSKRGPGSSSVSILRIRSSPSKTATSFTRQSSSTSSEKLTRLKTIFTNMWSTDMWIYQAWKTLMDVILSYCSVLLVMYHIGLRNKSTVILVFIYIFDVLFLTKIYVGFHTSHRDKTTGVPITNLKTIAKRYLKSWFWLDLISLLPIEVFAYISPDPVLMETLFFWLKLNRMLRIIFIGRKFLSMFSRLNVSNNSQWTYSLIWITFLIELFMCLYLMFVCSRGQCRYQRRYNSAQNAYTASDANAVALAHLYVINLFSNIGLHDASPTTMQEIVYELITLVVFHGAVMLVIGNSASLLENSNHTAANYIKDVDRMICYLKDHDLSWFLLNITLKYTKELWLRENGEYMPVLLTALPSYLRQDVMTSLYGRHLHLNSVLGTAHNDFLDQLTTRMKRYVFFPGDNLTERGDVDANIFFLHEGFVDVVHRNPNSNKDTIMRIKVPNDTLSLQCLCYPTWPHIHTYRARTVVHVLVLNYYDCQSLMNSFPSAWLDVQENADFLPIYGY